MIYSIFVKFKKLKRFSRYVQGNPLICLILVIISQNLTAQNTLAIDIENEKNEPLIGASAQIKSLNVGGIANEKGHIVITNIPNGKFEVVFSFIGYKEKKKEFIFPISFPELRLEVELESQNEDLDEVTITSTTRSSRNIKDIPTRIETISAGELEEGAVMQPANIKMLLTESTGIQTQQTSQVSGSASIRIQGLDGKYTQILQDGFPIYSGFASGLSILEIPPLNLKRVEVIKGSSSTLYGGGAIAGLINLITKEPTSKRELSALVNVNQTGALDASFYASERFKNTGFTLYLGQNNQSAYDANGDGLSDIPKTTRSTLNLKFFYYPTKNATLSIGLNAGIETRLGGDMKVINSDADSVHTFFEENKTNRYSSQIKFEKTFENKNILTLKNSVGFFNRKINGSLAQFAGTQWATFTEINCLIPSEKSELNMGLDINTDNFIQNNISAQKLDYYTATSGVFVQNTFNFNEKLILESGMRADVSSKLDILVLPRLSLLYKINEHFTSRIGGGLGYKLPTVFSEEAEERNFQSINTINFTTVSSEKSYGLNADINFKTHFGDEVFFNSNLMFFTTNIQNPIILISNKNYFDFANANGNILSRGYEINTKLRFDELSFFLGYTFIDAERNFNNTPMLNPLTAKHRINGNIMYEIENSFRLAYEVFFTGSQNLNNGEQVRNYWVMGISAEKKFAHFSIFANAEDFLDTRQSRWESLYSGSLQSPNFREIYTPVEGAIFNGGVRFSL